MNNQIRRWGMGRLLVVAAFGALMSGCYVGAEGRPDAVDDRVLADPDSLAGVEVDGALTTNAKGEFVFDAGARAVFDHFLAAEGEVDEESLHARVRQEIELQLTGAAVEQAWDAFWAYLEYREELSALAQRYAGTEPEAAVDPMLAELAQIRARTVGDVPGIEDEGPRVRAALAMREAFEDSSITPQERARRLAVLQAEQGQASDPGAPSKRLLRIRAALRSVPRDDTEARRAIVAAEAGEAAAERWLALERRQAQALVAGG